MHLYLVMFTLMTCKTFYDLAGRALLSSLACGSVVRANSRLFTGREISQEFVGAPLSGFLFAAAWSALAGASTLAGVLSAGVVQLTVPEQLMGRVLSAKKMLSFSLLPLGALVGGLLGRVDLRVPAIFGALVVVVATLWAWSRLRVMATRADEAEHMARRSTPLEE